MTEGSKQRARQLFMDVADLPADQRDAALQRLCGDEPLLRAEVLALLAADADAGGFMASPTANDLTVIAKPNAAPAEREGQLIDRYKLLQPIGEGGFGTVWMAEQREPVKRRVALKVIKLGMDTRQVIARFEAERQALAMMDHPNIAKVLDAGATETGRPYFVMEYIKGVPIVEYCDTERLDTRARLDLFTSVCQAIQHAHQKGIIHRDIKSSNVLVTLHDGVPVPKVIDFGIAKATSAELTQKTLFTEHRQMIGTPAYMSPEQAEMSGLDIDTRSDIYSLGVLLYELLTGTTPFATEDLLSKGFAEMMRIIREVEPHKPSTRLDSLGASASRTAQQRQATDQARLSSILRGDLDWIVMKCLEKDRTRRYESASGLALDIRRHLTDEPVSAGPPSTSYKLHKFVRRNRGKVVAGSIVAAALVLGVVGTSAGMVWALNERTRANDAAERERLARLAAQENETKAVAEATRSQRISEFVKAALEAGDAYNEGGGQSTTVLDAMDKALREIDSGRFKNDPETEAMLQCTIAGVLTNNGRMDEGENLNRRALETLRAAHSSDNINLAAGINGLARILAYRNKAAEAEPLFRESIAMLQRINPGDSPHLATSLNNLGFCLLKQGRPADAEEWFHKAIAMDERLSAGADTPSVAMALDNLAKALSDLRRTEEASQLAARALAMRERLFKGDHPDLAVGLSTLARIRVQLGATEEADVLFRRSLEMIRRLFKTDTEFLGTSLLELAQTRQELGHVEEAESLCKEAISAYERLQGPTGPETTLARVRLGQFYLATGRSREAESIFQSTLDLHSPTNPSPGKHHAALLDGLGRVRFQLGRTDEGIELVKQALALRRSRVAADHPDTFDTLHFVGGMLGHVGRSEEAEPFLREAVEMGSRLFPETSPLLLEARDTLGVNLWRTGKHELAIATYESVLAIRSRELGPNHPDTLATQANLGINYKDAGRLPEAIRTLSYVDTRNRTTPLLRLDYVGPALLEVLSVGADPSVPEHREKATLLVDELLPAIRAELPAGSPELAARLAQCASTLVRVHEWTKAEPIAREALRIRASVAPQEWTTANSRSLLGGILLAQNNLTEAEPLLLTGYQDLKRLESSIPSPARFRIGEALDRLIDLASATGNSEDLAKWRAERANYPAPPR